jgi:hypothetical protein
MTYFRFFIALNLLYCNFLKFPMVTQVWNPAVRARRSWKNPKLPNTNHAEPIPFGRVAYLSMDPTPLVDIVVDDIVVVDEAVVVVVIGNVVVAGVVVAYSISWPSFHKPANSDPSW